MIEKEREFLQSLKKKQMLGESVKKDSVTLHVSGIGYMIMEGTIYKSSHSSFSINKECHGADCHSAIYYADEYMESLRSALNNKATILVDANFLRTLTWTPCR